MTTAPSTHHSPDGVGNPPRPTVIIIDDHALFREGVRAALGDRATIVAEADDVQSGIDAVQQHEPDVVLLDLHLTSGSGHEVITAILAMDPPITSRFLGLSVSDEPTDVLALVRAGAQGYVTKRIDGTELADAVERVAAGDAVFSPRLAGFVLDAFRREQPDPDITPCRSIAVPSVPDGGAALNHAVSTETGGTESTESDMPDHHEIDRLSARERQVMQLLARGYTYKEIGRDLYISARTVESHTSSVLRKLQLSNRHELTHWAARHNLLGEA